MPEIKYDSVKNSLNWVLNNSGGLLSVTDTTTNNFLDTLRPFRVVGKVDPNDVLNPINTWHPRTDTIVIPVIEGAHILTEIILNGPTPLKVDYTDLNTETLGIEMVRGGVLKQVQITFAAVASAANVAAEIGADLAVAYGGGSIASDFSTLSDGAATAGRIRIGTNFNSGTVSSGDYVRILSKDHATPALRSTQAALDYLGLYGDQIVYAPEQNVSEFSGPGAYAQGIEARSPGDSSNNSNVRNRPLANMWAEIGSLRDYFLALIYGIHPASDSTVEFSFSGVKNFLNHIQLYKDATYKNEWARTETVPFWQPFTDISTGNRVTGSAAFFGRESTYSTIVGEADRVLSCEFTAPSVIGAGGDSVLWHGTSGSNHSYMYFGDQFYVAPLAYDATNFVLGHPHVFFKHQGNQIKGQIAIGTNVSATGAGEYPFNYSFIDQTSTITNAISITKTYGCAIGPAVASTLGDNAFASGNSSEATGNNSSAMGNTVIASGIAAHAEGRGVTASGENSHAEGYLTYAAGENSHSEGESTGAATHGAKGKNSHSEGLNTFAEGLQTHAEGTLTHAKGADSHAEGQATALGDLLAEGIASHAEGKDTHAKGPYAHSEGKDTYAEGQASHAEGLGDGLSTAKGALGDFSHTEGHTTTAFGEASHAEGWLTYAEGQASHAEGHGDGTNTYGALGQSSHSEGDLTKAEGDNSHAEGDTTTATGDASHAEGNTTDAQGNNSHAEGSNTIAYTDNSHAEGYKSKTKHFASHAQSSHDFIGQVGSAQFERFVISDVIELATQNVAYIGIDSGDTFTDNSSAYGAYVADGNSFSMDIGAVYSFKIRCLAVNVDNTTDLILQNHMYSSTIHGILRRFNAGYVQNSVETEDTDVFSSGCSFIFEIYSGLPYIEFTGTLGESYQLQFTVEFTEIETKVAVI